LHSKISFGPAATTSAFAAVWNGEHERALALLHNVDAAGCAVMRARVWLRLERFERVVSEYDRRALAAYDPVEATGLACCAAVARASLGDSWSAHAALEAARLNAECSGDQLLALQQSYTAMLVDLLSGNVEGSRAAAPGLSATARELPPIDARTPYQWELAHLRARIFQHEGRHFELENDRAASERCFTEALLAAESARRRDRFLEAQLLALLSGIVAEAPVPEARARALARANETAWSSHTERSGSYVSAALADNRRLFGSSVAPVAKAARGAHSLASRLGDRVHALLLEAWPAGSGFYDECRFAVSLALDIDWSATLDYEAMHLARLAIVLAPWDVSVARRMLDAYETRLAQLSPNSAMVRGPGRVPIELFAAACIAKAEARFGEAAEMLVRVARLWSERGLTWAVALAGLERFSVTRDDVDLEPARAFAVAFPSSSFSRRLREALPAARSEPSAFPYLGLYCGQTPQR
jgi:hypothetical protein